MSAVLKPRHLVDLLDAAKPAAAPGLSHLDWLESEAIHIMREVAAEARNPALLFSGGKDSIVMLRIAEKAFRPDRFPFPLLHIDTEHNFPEVIAFRDARAAELGERLIVRSVGESIRAGRVRLARPDESRDPRNQRPELWSLFNARLGPGEHLRVFPLSNWTELDIWQYIARESLAVPRIYFAHERDVIERRGLLVPATELTPSRAGEAVVVRRVRFRTVGDITCTCPVASDADTLDKIIAETAGATITERGATRMDDQTSDASMELRKREGYF